MTRTEAIARAIYENAYKDNPYRIEEMVPSYDLLKPYVNDKGEVVDQEKTMLTLAQICEKCVECFPYVNEADMIETMAGGMSDFYHPLDEIFEKYPPSAWDEMMELNPKMTKFAPFEYSPDDNKNRFRTYARVALEAYRANSLAGSITENKRQFVVHKE